MTAATQLGIIDDAKLEEIERVARAATPGPWFHREKHAGRDWIADVLERGRHSKIILGSECLYGGAKDYTYIAALDPPTALDLVAAIRADRKRIAELVEGLRELEGKLFQRIDRFQDMVGWQPGESRNALVTEIRDAACVTAAALLKPGSET